MAPKNRVMKKLNIINLIRKETGLKLSNKTYFSKRELNQLLTFTVTAKNEVVRNVKVG